MEYRYHRLASSSDYPRWWRFPLALLFGSFAFFWIGLIYVGWAWLLEPDTFNKLRSSELDLTDPFTMALALGSIALLIPALYLALFVVWHRPIGLISSVEGRLRWRWLGQTTVAAILVFAISFGVWFVLGGLPTDFKVGAIDWGTAGALILVAFLFTPLQAAAEEYVFRGFFMQLFGYWIKNPVIVGALTVLPFVAGHTYDFWGLVDVAVFAIFAAYLVWRTGGLEAAIAAHVVNNLLLFILGSVELSNLNAESGSPISILSTLLTMGAFTFVVVRLANKNQIAVVRLVEPANPETIEPAAAFDIGR